jgi:hypothetical protein
MCVCVCVCVCVCIYTHTHTHTHQRFGATRCLNVQGYAEPTGITSQKSVIFALTEVKTWHLTWSLWRTRRAVEARTRGHTFRDEQSVPKRRFLTTSRRRVITQKTINYIHRTTAKVWILKIRHTLLWTFLFYNDRYHHLHKYWPCKHC